MSARSVPNYVIDTDPGIDDAMAICMALEAHCRGKINVVAFTLVNGNTEIQNAVINIKRVLSFFPTCRKIPVYCGAETGLVKEFDHPTGRFHGVDGFNGVLLDKDHEEDFDLNLQDQPAALALIELATLYKGELSLICLGPLTNLAVSMKADSRFIGQIKSVLLMGGNTEGIGNASVAAEFNFYADPEAAYVVLRNTDKPITIVGWELCYLYTNLTKDWRNNVLGNVDHPRAKFLNAIEEPWLTSQSFKKLWAACDQLIMAVAIDANCAKETKSFYATVELQGEITRGQMVLEKRCFVERTDYSRPDNVNIVTELDLDLVKHYLKLGFGHFQ